MAARTRGRRSTARTGARKRRSGTKRWYLRPDFIGVAIVAGTIAVLPWLIDLPAALSEIRDWFARTFGLGLFILALLSVAGGVAISRQTYREGGAFVRRAAGIGALALFTWGMLGLNHSEWRLGSVEFSEVSLGGEAGALLVGGPLGVLVWLGLGVAAMALLAPAFSLFLARETPEAAATAWERRYPHRVVAGIGRFVAGFGSAIAFVLGRRGDQEAFAYAGTGELVIGGYGYERRASSYEEPPIGVPDRTEAGEPVSAVGSGAAAQFAHEAADTVPEVAQQLPFIEASTESAIDDDEGDDPAEGSGAEPIADVPDAPGGGWLLPQMELFTPPKPAADAKRDNAARAQLIVDTLASFGVDASVAEINEGPTVTQFGVEPGWEVRYKDVPLKDESRRIIIADDGQPVTRKVETARTRVRVNRITRLQDDLALALAAPTLRIEAPVPGRAIVGIEVPNDSAAVVTIRGVMETDTFQALERKSKLALPLGMGVTGTPVVADLAKMPHLLIAGATGSGKSVCMNAIICGILTNATPDQVRFVMIDPKRVELTGYKEIPHMAFSDVIVDAEKVVGTLQAVVGEMEARYRKFEDAGVRNIEAYNRSPKVLKRLPYWVVLIDELADLMMVAPYEVEKLLCRLAQLARATGIHLVVATQRPSVDVITGLIKANFPTRIAFAMTSVVDSRTVLDMGGAEKLLGRGDMLYMPTDEAKPKRIQGVYVSDEEVEAVVRFWTDERFAELAPERSDDLLEEALRDHNGGDDEFEVEENDPFYAAARDLAGHHTRISSSMLQRRLEIGAVKATAIIERMTREGILGPAEGGESRAVIRDDAPAEFD